MLFPCKFSSGYQLYFISKNEIFVWFYTWVFLIVTKKTNLARTEISFDDVIKRAIIYLQNNGWSLEFVDLGGEAAGKCCFNRLIRKWQMLTVTGFDKFGSNRRALEGATKK